MHIIKKLILALALILTASHSHSADWVGIGVSEKNLYSYDRGFIKRLKAEPSIRLTTLQLVPIKEASKTKYVFTEVDCKYEMIRAHDKNINPMWMDASDDIIIAKIVRSVCEAIPQ
jgi:hypothetical protein